MAWIIAALLAIILVAAAAFVVRRGFTYFHPSGFTSYGADGFALRPVPRDRYERILARFVQGDLADLLWLSHLDDANGGVGLLLVDGEIEIDVNFLHLKEPERVADFRSQMLAWGHAPAEESTGNAGLGPDMEHLILEYRAPRDVASVQTLVDRMLTLLEGPAETSIYVAARNLHLPRTRFALKAHSREDPLDEVP